MIGAEFERQAGLKHMKSNYCTTVTGCDAARFRSLFSCTMLTMNVMCQQKHSKANLSAEFERGQSPILSRSKTSIYAQI